MPYLAGSRARLEIFVFAALTGVALFRIVGNKRYLVLLPARVYYLSAVAFIYTLVLAGISEHASVLNRLIDIINQNFLFLTLFGLLPLGHWLRNNAAAILKSAIIASIIVNIIAVLQISFPSLSLHDILFALYGGQVGDHGLSSAEFLCRVAHRCTSIFPTLQALALFELLIIALLMYLINSRQISPVIFWVAIILAFMGGLASVSKTFLIGAPAIVLLTLWRSHLPFVSLAALIVVPILVAVSIDYQFVLGRNINFIDGMKEYGLGYIFASRFGGAGYEISVFEKLYNSMKDIPNIFVFGVGSDYSYYGAEYVDHMYLQLIIYGGVPYAMLFIGQYLLFFIELARRAWGSGRDMVYAIASTHFAIGFAYAVFFVGRYTMLMVLILLVVTLDCRARRLKLTPVRPLHFASHKTQVSSFQNMGT